MNVTAAIYARLVAGVGTRLAGFNGSPAIFSDRTPDAFQFGPDVGPVAVIAAATGDDDDDTFTELRRVIVQDVRLYAHDGGSAAAFDTLAREVRDLFHHQEAAFVLDAGRVTVITVAGPIASPVTDPAVIGRRLTLHLTLEES